MARKTFVDLSDTLNAFRVKTNVISYNVGDLDSLHSSLPDSDLVQAINFLRSNDSNNFVNLQAQITSNDSDVINLQSQITTNDSDILNLQAQITRNDSDVINLQSQITTNDSDINHLQLQIASNNDSLASERLARIAGDNNLQTQITNNDSDILALQTVATVRTVQLSILKSDGSLVKRIFGFSDSGD